MLSPAIVRPIMDQRKYYQAVVSQLPKLRQLHESLRRQHLPDWAEAGARAGAASTRAKAPSAPSDHTKYSHNVDSDAVRRRYPSRASHRNYTAAVDNRRSPSYPNNARTTSYENARTQQRQQQQPQKYGASTTDYSRMSADMVRRSMSDEISRGTDLLADSLAHGPRRKIVLESYAPSGVDVKGLVQAGHDAPHEDDNPGDLKVVHMNGSILAFPDACFLWNVKDPKEVTLDSLSAVMLYRPSVEYLFIGCDTPLPPRELKKAKKEFRKRDVVVEQLDVMNAMGTFNILNGEDRRVACALVIDPEDES